MKKITLKSGATIMVNDRYVGEIQMAIIRGDKYVKILDDNDNLLYYFVINDISAISQ